MSWLAPEGPNSTLGPSPQAIAQKRVPSTTEFGPWADFIPGAYGKPGETLAQRVQLPTSAMELGLKHICGIAFSTFWNDTIAGPSG